MTGLGARYMEAQDISLIEKWDNEADVVVIGYGGAGVVAAISAHDAGAKIIALEKRPSLASIGITDRRVPARHALLFEFFQALIPAQIVIIVIVSKRLDRKIIIKIVLIGDVVRNNVDGHFLPLNSFFHIAKTIN